MENPPRGRYAPSPTGELHVGNASTALLAWLSIRARGGRFVMRIEDLDRNRSRPELARSSSTIWRGSGWTGTRGRPTNNGSGRERYLAAFERLREAGRLYPCFCSRKEIAAAASAPQDSPGDELQLRGNLPRARSARGAASRRGRRAARLALPYRPRRSGPCFTISSTASGTATRGRCGDFVVHRSLDGVPAYQLAVVVDDAEMRIDEVVRGDDLLSSTRRQILLGDTLGFERPVYGHAPLLLGADGVRLSKRHEGITLRELREGGVATETLVGDLAHAVGPD